MSKIYTAALGATLTTCLGFALACGGDAMVGSAEPEFDVSFQTFEAGRDRIEFSTETTFKYTWRNMSGSAVKGTYTHEGKELVLTIPDDTENTSQREMKLRQIDECSMARWAWIDDEGEVHDDDSKLYERTKPKCR